MERALKRLFDFQRFSGSLRLAEMIADTEKRCGNALSDDALEAVNAAGELIPPHIREGDSDD